MKFIIILLSLVCLTFSSVVYAETTIRETLIPSDLNDRKLRNSRYQLNTTSSTNTYDQAIYYGQTHPNRDGEVISNVYLCL